MTGGATAVFLGLREQTIDIHIELDPEPGGVIQAIGRLKNDLDVNVELAAPDRFLPPLPDWKERSAFIESVAKVTFRHYDFYAQALAKIERGHEHDLADARSSIQESLVDPAALRRCFESTREEMVRFPAIDADDLELRLNELLESAGITHDA